jgi:hypothetical protein
VKQVSNAELKSSASFKIPYNYRLSGALWLSAANSIVLAGQSVGYTGNVYINAAQNTDVNEYYATATRPDTEYKVTAWYVNASQPTRPGDYVETQNSNGNPCTFFSNIISGTCSQVTSAAGQLTDGTTATYITSNRAFPQGGSRVIEDMPIGTKFCMALSIRNYEVGNRTGKAYSGDDGYGQSGGVHWYHTSPSCIAIGKKPSAQVWAANLFSAGPVRTGFQVKTSTNNVYGSWSEYAALGQGTQGTIVGLGSGAAFAESNTLPVSGGGLASNCGFSLITLANNTCGSPSTAPLGQGNIERGRAREIALRYWNPSPLPDTWQTYPASSVNLSTLPAMTSGKTVLQITGGNMTITGGTLAAGRTVVINSTGVVTIADSVQYTPWGLSGISQIPQLLIFAQEIRIESRATRVDAWLLAGLQGGTGIVKTCSDGSFIYGVYGGNQCGDQLKINGPIIAKQMWLHRSHFDNSGATMPPSEILNLRSDAFLWAYSQSQNTSQAFLTYSREVAPRY